MSEPTPNLTDRPNLIDRAIESVAPVWAAKRVQARAMLAAHRGGLQTRTSTPWGVSTSIKGGTLSGRQNQGKRRDRARKVWQEHAIGRSLLQTETDNVVGSGFPVQAKTKSAAFNSEAEDRWNAWLDVADIRGLLPGSELQRQFYRSSRRDGDGGVVLVDRGGRSRLQFIPGDLIATPDRKWGDTSIVDGVEIDGVSRPVAFHIKSEDEAGKKEWARVPAENFVYFAPVVDEDMGVRGDTCYSQVFGYLDQIDGYIDAVIIAARMACVFGLIEKTASGPKTFAGLGTATNSEGNKQKALTLENGMLKYIGPDDSIMQVQAQQPMQQTPDFIRAICRLIGLPFDMPLELVCKDMSQVNFASARIGLIGYYRSCRARQAFYRSRWDRIYQWWISREVKMGMFKNAAPQDYWSHRFEHEGWDYTDPVSEAQADLLQIDMGIKTPQMAAAERGRDWEEMQIALKAAAAAQRLLTLPVASTYTRDRVVQQAEPVNATPDPETPNEGTDDDQPQN